MNDLSHDSSTLSVPQVGQIPQHIAIIMDGNGRWATKRKLPRMVGHERGVAALRGVVEGCMRLGVKYLTVFAFSSENWRRPEEEVSFLMGLFLKALKREVRELVKHGVRLRIVGDLSGFNQALRDAISQAENETQANDTFHLTVAANYGGRWDILQATRRMLDLHPSLAQQGVAIPEDLLKPQMAMSFAPEPDLFIRTGGEQRISNFLLWQLAYTELYFTECFWPEFDQDELTRAIQSYQQRERRFGRTSAQVTQCSAPAS